MGRPASLERHSRGPWYRGAQGSPTKVTAPGSALTIKIREASCDPREMFRHSAHSFQAINKRDKEQTRQDHYIIPYNIATKGRQTRWHKPRHGHAQSGLPGAATRTRADAGPRISAVRTNFLQFHSQIQSHSLANSFATLNSQLFLCDLVAKIR